MIRPTTYTIFLSRPSDVESDIEVVKDAISDANCLAAPLGAQFATFDWRENATPGLALEPQARINEQAHGYDVIIALLGATLGTPTINHASGSVEEIESAIDEASNTPFGNDSVLIFFKDVKINLSSDLDEAKRVQELKQSLGPRGILYRSYQGDDDLRSGILRSLGVLIGRHNSFYNHEIKVDDDIENKSSELVVDNLAISELCLMDYGELASEDMAIAAEAAEKLGAAMSVLGEFVSKKTPEFTEANSKNDQSEIRAVISEVADAMKICAQDVQVEGDEMSSSFKRCLFSLRNILDIQVSDLSEYQSEAEFIVAESVTSSLKVTINLVINQVSEFKKSIIALPRLTKELNNSKRLLLVSIENLIISMDEIVDELSAINEYSKSNINSDDS